MPNKKNIEAVFLLKEEIANSQGLIFFDYRGITTAQLDSIRKELSKTNSVLKICKNSLVNIALKDIGRGIKDEFFVNPTAVVFAKADVSSAAKVVHDASKKNDKIKVKGGYFEEDVLDSKGVEVIANIPSKEVLLSHLVTALEAPISSFVYSTQSIISCLAYVLETLKEKKSA